MSGKKEKGMRDRALDTWGLVAVLGLVLAAGAYCTKVESAADDLRCKEIMQNGTPEAKLHATKWGPCN